MNEELKQLRGVSAEYTARDNDCQESCSSVQKVPLQNRGKGVAPDRKVK